MNNDLSESLSGHLNKIIERLDALEKFQRTALNPCRRLWCVVSDIFHALPKESQEICMSQFPKGWKKDFIESIDYPKDPDISSES